MHIKTIKEKAAQQLLLLVVILIKTKYYWQVVSNFKTNVLVQSKRIILSDKRYINMKMICFKIKNFSLRYSLYF